MTVNNHKKIFIIMPAYLAGRKIKSVFERIDRQTMAAIEHFIIVVDGNADDTLQKAKEIKAEIDKVTIVYHEQNRGYGRAQKSGYRKALDMGADICAMLHADGQYAPEMLLQLLEPLRTAQADLVMGSRMLEKGKALKGGMPRYKYVANRILTFAENKVYGLNISEYHSGYMLYSRIVLENVPYETLSDGFHFDGEMLLHSSKKGFRLEEIPIDAHYADEERTLSPIKYGFEVLGVMWRYSRGNYDV